jgi:hypothetical protein
MKQIHQALVVALLLIAVSALPLSAWPGTTAQDQDQSPRYTHLKLRTGTSLRAHVLEVDGARYRLQVSVQGGTSSGWYEFDSFEDESQVRLLESQVAEDDPAAQLAVAEFAVDKGLTEIARRELRKCSHIAMSASADVREDIAPRAVALTVRLIEAYAEMGKLSEARHGVDRILVRKASVLTQEQKDSLVEAVEAAARRQEEERASQREEEAVERADRDRAKRLEPILKELEKAQDLRREGLMSSSSYSKASRLLERSVKEFESVLNRSQKLRARSEQDPTTLKEIDRIEERASSQLQDTLLANASLDLARGKFSSAMGAVNRILADEPDHQRALAMRARIETAENDWGW